MKLAAIFLLPALMWAGVTCGKADTASRTAPADSVSSQSAMTDSLRVAGFPLDSLPAGDASDRYSHLTEEDFRIVAEELDVEVAAIKAVVLIEAGKQMKGFFAPECRLSTSTRPCTGHMLRKPKTVRETKTRKSRAGLTGYALREWTQLVNARRKNSDGANMGTFWGMFQIGGFNYKQCGCSDVDEFVEIMSESEFSQLELFAKFITNTGMLTDLRNKNWAGFARKYNGASYARRGYHTRMAAAYRKFKSGQ